MFGFRGIGVAITHVRMCVVVRVVQVATAALRTARCAPRITTASYASTATWTRQVHSMLLTLCFGSLKASSCETYDALHGFVVVFAFPGCYPATITVEFTAQTDKAGFVLYNGTVVSLVFLSF